MKFRNSRVFSIFMLCLMLIASITGGCSSGGSGGGISGTGITQGDDVSIGTITGFGSVIVNQKQLNSDAANVIINGQPATVSDLRIGMRVTTRANFDTSVASLIEYTPLLIAPVSIVDTQTDKLSILGYDVQITPSTRFDGLAQSSITTSSVLEVSGYFNADNIINATFIRAADNNSQYQLLAQISSIGNDFSIATQGGMLEAMFDQLEQQIDFQLNLLDQLSEFTDVPTRDAIFTLPANGNAFTTPPSFSFLVPQVPLVSGNSVDIRQPVLSSAQNGLFTTEDFQVMVNQSTIIQFANGALADAGALQRNQLLDISGTIVQGDQLVLAERIIVLDGL